MCDLLDNGKIVFTGTYVQCVKKYAALRALAALTDENHEFTIQDSTIDPDGSTGYVL